MKLTLHFSTQFALDIVSPGLVSLVFGSVAFSYLLFHARKVTVISNT
jgi:hypothetical protein